MSRYPSWVNGRFVRSDEPVLSAEDQGFLLGLAVFESLVCERGAPLFLAQHLARLESGARALRLAWPPPYDVEAALGEFCRRVAASDPERPFIVRVTYSRGTPVAGPTLVVGARDVVPPPPEGVAVVLVPGAKSAGDWLENVKSTNRVRNVLAREDAQAVGAWDALLCSDAGDVVEGTICNLFCLTRGRLLTPALERGCLPGVTRGLLLEELRGGGLPRGVESLEEGRVERADLASADEVFLTNSSGRLIPVTAVRGCNEHLPGPRGAVWKALRDRFVTLEARDLANRALGSGR